MAIVDRVAGFRWPWVETGQGSATSDIGMQVFRAAASDATRAVVLADVDGAIVYANHTFHELNGDDAHRITRGGMAALSGISPGVVEDVWRGLGRGEPWKKQLHFRKRRAKNCPCGSSISPLKSTQGRVTHILGCHVECEEHDTGQNALRSALNRADGRTEDNCFVAVIDRDERIIYNGCTQPGFSNLDVIGSTLREYCPPEQHDVIASRVARALRSGTEESYEMLAAGAYGAMVHYASWTGPLSVGGQVIAAVSKSLDVSDRDMIGQSGVSPNGEIGAAPITPIDKPLLSQRELEVTRLLAEGLTNNEIACSLGIARRTVDHHVAHILTKLGAPNRAAAVCLAMTDGLIIHA